MAWIALVLGFALVWSLGIAVVAAATRVDTYDDRSDLAWLLGSGWFVGSFLLTLWMRALSVVHVSWGIASIAVPLAVLALVFARLAWRTAAPWSRWSGSVRRLLGTHVPGWHRWVWIALVAWITIHFVLLLMEIARRPLYPWDAWVQWATKARVWFELRHLAPFVNAPEWLQAASALVYSDAAPHYPGTVPLWQVWAAILAGRWDDVMINFPWWITGVALAFAMYGYLAREGFAPLAALVGTWLVVSLPIVDTHIALAGYADLPMAGFLTVTVMWALIAAREHRPGSIAVALLLAAACVLVKNPGRVWIAVMLPAVVVAALPRLGLRIAGICFAVAGIVVLMLARTDPILFGYRLHLEFAMPWGGLYDAYFALANWHLLWYGVVAMAVIAWRHLLRPAVAPYTVAAGAGLLFLLFGFAFTNARLWVEDQTTVNRATLHLAPLLVVWMLVAFRAWAEGLRVAGIPAEPTAERATPG